MSKNRRQHEGTLDSGVGGCFTVLLIVALLASSANAGEWSWRDSPQAESRLDRIEQTVARLESNVESLTVQMTRLTDHVESSARQTQNSLDNESSHDASESTRVAIYYADWANYHDETEQLLNQLRRGGWDVGESESCQIQVVELDPHSRELHELRIGNLPCFIKFRHGHEYERHTGLLSGVDVWEMYHGRNYIPEDGEQQDQSAWRAQSRYSGEPASRDVYQRRTYQPASAAVSEACAFG